MTSKKKAILREMNVKCSRDEMWIVVEDGDRKTGTGPQVSHDSRYSRRLTDSPARTVRTCQAEPVCFAHQESQHCRGAGTPRTADLTALPEGSRVRRNDKRLHGGAYQLKPPDELRCTLALTSFESLIRCIPKSVLEGLRDVGSSTPR